MSKLFGFPSGEMIYDKAQGILMDKYHLVRLSPSPTSTRGHIGNHWKIMVKRNGDRPTGTRLFYVHFYRDQEWRIPDDGKRYDVFLFHYALSDGKLDPERISGDPMRAPLERIISLSENRYDTDFLYIGN